MREVVPKCASCGAGMKMLVVSYFCPNDCDRKGKATTSSGSPFMVGRLYWVAVSEQRSASFSRRIGYEVTMNTYENLVFTSKPTQAELGRLPHWAAGVQQAAYAGVDKGNATLRHYFIPNPDRDAFIPR